MRRVLERLLIWENMSVKGSPRRTLSHLIENLWNPRLLVALVNPAHFI